MNNAAWLSLALPEWYFSTILAPLGAGPLSAIPAFGTACLGIGVVLGFAAGERSLFLFLIPAAITELFVAIAGAMRGLAPYDSHILTVALSLFVGLQIILAIYLVFAMKGARLAATALALFSVTYAMFATFIAGMSITNDWL
jgi:hypothetical protein